MQNGRIAQRFPRIWLGLSGVTAVAVLLLATWEFVAAEEYVVQPGDTLIRISERHGQPLAELVRLNQIADPNRIGVGQHLILAAPPAAAPSEPDPSRFTPSARGEGRTEAVTDTALKLVGRPYAWGGSSPETGFDCSGLAIYVFRQSGKLLPRDLWGQLRSGPSVARESLQPGDLVFFQNTYTSGLSHVGIFVGDGRFVHAEDESNGVTVSLLAHPYWSSRFFGASRP